MHEKILTSLNWLDVLMIIVMAGTVFRGATQGFVVEFFRILATLCAIILGLHFFVPAGEALHQSVLMPENVGELLSFIAICAVTMLVFKLVREGWLLILKVEAKSGFSQWGGAFLAIGRSFLVCGQIFFLIFLIGNMTLITFAEKSISGYYLRDLSPKVYKAAFDGVIVKFFPDEPISGKALKTTKKETTKKK